MSEPQGFQPGPWVNAPAPQPPQQPYPPQQYAPRGTWQSMQPVPPQSMTMPPMTMPPVPTMPATSPEPEKTSKVGEIGLLLDIAALLIGCVLASLSGSFLKQVRSIAGPDWADIDPLPPEADAAFMNFSLTLVAQFLPTLLGLAGIVLGLIALRRPSSRGWGIAAIAVGLAAPLLVGFLLLVMMMQQMG